MTDGMKCHDCGERHNDWEKAGESAVQGAHIEGIIKTYRCGKCGGETEVPVH